MERKGGKVRDQLNVEQMFQKRSSESGQQLQCGGKTCLWESIMDNHHGTKKGKSGVTACVLSAGTSLDVSSDISTATEASSLDCHFCGVDSPPAFKTLSYRG